MSITDGNEPTVDAATLRAEIRRLTAENEALRAKCAEGFYILRRMVKTNEERHPIGDALMRLARSFVKKDNPGQALLDRLKMLEPAATDVVEHIAATRESFHKREKLDFGGYATGECNFEWIMIRLQEGLGIVPSRKP